ncbi:MAG: PLP-dependent transferase [Pseudomonadota bacterium]
MTDPTTQLIHHPYVPPEGFVGMAPPVHRASTVIFPNTAALHARQWKDKTGYTYGLHGTPTTFVLEERIATLEGGLQCLLVPSGLAAISLVDMALLRSGDEVLIPDNAYGPNKEFARHELARWGIAHRCYDPLDLAATAALITPATRLIWVEAPGSVTMEFPDLLGLITLARTRGITVALDNTWGAGLAFNAFDLTGDGSVGVDISVQALTKYPSGGGDVLMGSVTTRALPLHHTLKFCHMRTGWGVGGNDVEMVLRSLPSMALRYDAQDRAARALAAWWARQSEVVQLLHPAFAHSPGHAHWQALSTRAAGLFSVVLDACFSAAQVNAFLDALTVFKLGYSWAGPISLVVPYDLSTMRGRPAWAGRVVRFSVGLEAVDDLVLDCEQALQVLRAA